MVEIGLWWLASQFVVVGVMYWSNPDVAVKVKRIILHGKGAK